MKLLFKLEDQVHTFTTLGDINQNDLAVLRASLLKFMETAPPFTVIDLSESQILTDHSHFLQFKGELKTLASSKRVELAIAETDIEARCARRTVLEAALKKELAELQNKIELRENVRAEAEKLLAENAKLKSLMTEQLSKAKNGNAKTQDSLIQPLIDKLWSEK